MKYAAHDGSARLRVLADVLRDPMIEVHDPRGYASACVEAARLIESNPRTLRGQEAIARFGKRRVEVLKALPRIETRPVPESQRQAVREARELAHTVIDAGSTDAAALTRLVAIHRRHRGGSFYDQNIGKKRHQLLDALYEQPYRRRRRKHNPTPTLSAVGMGEALARVKAGIDKLVSMEARDRDVSERARTVQTIAELVARYPSILARPYARRQLGKSRLAVLERLLALS